MNLLIQIAIHTFDVLYNKEQIEGQVIGYDDSDWHKYGGIMWGLVYLLVWKVSGNVWLAAQGLIVRFILMTYLLNLLRGLSAFHTGQNLIDRGLAWIYKSVARLIALISYIFNGGGPEKPTHRQEIEKAQRSISDTLDEPTFKEVFHNAFIRGRAKYATLFIIFFNVVAIMDMKGVHWTVAGFLAVINIAYFYGNYKASKKQLEGV